MDKLIFISMIMLTPIDFAGIPKLTTNLHILKQISVKSSKLKHYKVGKLDNTLQFYIFEKGKLTET